MPCLDVYVETQTMNGNELRGWRGLWEGIFRSLRVYSKIYEKSPERSCFHLWHYYHPYANSSQRHVSIPDLCSELHLPASPEDQ